MRKTSYLIFLILFTPIFNKVSYASIEVNNYENIEKRILDKIENIECYQLNTTVKIDGNIVPSKIYGQIPDCLRIEQKVEHSSEQLFTTVVFDGKIQWVESKASNKTQVLKIRSSELVSKNRPFDTGFYVMGTGLMNGEDFPSTIKILLSLYDLSADYRSDKVVLKGNLNLQKFEEYILKRKYQKNNPQLKDQFKRDFRFIKIIFGYPDYLIQGYSLGANNSKEKIKVIFKNIIINISVNEDVFDYKVPDGIQPIDIANEIIKSFGQ